MEKRSQAGILSLGHDLYGPARHSPRELHGPPVARISIGWVHDKLGSRQSWGYKHADPWLHSLVLGRAGLRLSLMFDSQTTDLCVISFIRAVCI